MLSRRLGNCRTYLRQTSHQTTCYSSQDLIGYGKRLTSVQQKRIFNPDLSALRYFGVISHPSSNSPRWHLCLFSLSIQAGRMVEAGWVMALILLTSNICLMYDYCMDESTFQVSPYLLHRFDSVDQVLFKIRVDAVGPIIFTLINMLPRFAVMGLLCREMIITSECPASGVFQAILAFSPGLLQMAGEVSLICREPTDITTSDATPSSETSRCVLVWLLIALLKIVRRLIARLEQGS